MVALDINRERVTDPQVPFSTRLIEFIKSSTRFRGPKLACGEGGCGACAVLCERYNPVTGVVSRYSINSCLATVGSLDGCAITTSEGLGNSKQGFHPIQDALARNFASQCGFCSPGIVVALAAAADNSNMGAHSSSSSSNSDHPAAVSMAQGLDGNLCRCTGWRPIIDACRDLADLEDLCSNSSSGCKASCNKNSSSGSRAMQAHCKAERNGCSNQGSFPQLAPFPEWLKQYVIDKHHQQQQQTVAAASAGVYNVAANNLPKCGSRSPMACHDQLWLSPCSLQQLASMLRQHGRQAQLVSGNTGAGVYKELWPHEASVVINTHAVSEMTHVSHQAHGVMLGGAVTIQQLLQVLRAPAAAAAERGLSSSSSNGDGGGVAPAGTARVWGAVADHVERIAGVHVRSAATLGGHFGLCDTHPLPTDLALLLAAAGAKLQVMTVRAQHHTAQQQQQQQYGRQCWDGQPGHQQQQQQPGQALDLKWMSAEEFLANSAVGQKHLHIHHHQQQQQQQQGPYATAAASAATAPSTAADGFDLLGGALLGPDCIAGAQLMQPEPTSSGQQQQQPARMATGSSSSMRVVTAVWLPYADDGVERYWSYRLSWRHVNSHAFVNMALWLQYEPSSSSSSSCGGDGSTGAVGAALARQADPAFAGCRVSAARLFLGCPPAVKTHITPLTGAAGADMAAAAAAVDDEAWLVLRAGGVEEVLTGSTVTVQGLVSALRSLEQELQQATGLAPSSFHSQALQGLLFKALVPLLHADSLDSLASQPPQDSLEGPGGGQGSSSSSRDRLLRVLLLPAVYDPKVLPEGRQVLPAPPGVKQQQQQQQQGTGIGLQSPQQQQQQQQEQRGMLHGKTAAGNSCPIATPGLIRCHPQLPPAASKEPHISAPAAAAAAVETPTVAAAAAEVWQAGGPGPAPLHVSIEKEGVRLQASGEAEYTADVAAKMGPRVLYLAGVRSTRALAALVCLDASAALALPGVVSCLTAADIPGRNDVFGAPLLADGKVEYVGQLIALVAATSQTAADTAAKHVTVHYADIPGQTPIITLEQAIAAGSFYKDQAAALKVEAVRHNQSTSTAAPTADDQELVTISSSSSDGAYQATGSPTPPAAAAAGPGPGSVCDLISAAPLRLRGCYSLPAQQHMYMETQTAVAEPGEDGAVKVWSATQSLDAVQQAVAAVLGVSFNQVAVITRRLGGGFGGKASRSMPVAAAAALAASLLHRPVCYSLNRNEDFVANAGRCAGLVEYDVGYTPQGNLVAIKAKVIFRAGAHLDLAMNDGAALVGASDSAYDLSGLSVEVRLARCNLPPHTIMRGPGYLQGCMFMEQIVEHVASALAKDSAEVKAENFLAEMTTTTTSSSSSSPSCDVRSAAAAAAGVGHGVVTALGRVLAPECYTLPRLWRELLVSSSYQQRLAAVREHNERHAWSKRGIAVTPVRFDCAPAAVSCSLSVYADGSVLVNHGGIEMGQGLSTKVKQAAVAALSQLLPPSQRPLPLALVRLSPSSSCVNPNAGPTWSSTGSEGNCQAVMDAAAQVVDRLRPSLKVGEDALATWQGTIAVQFSDVGFAPAAAMLSAYGYFNGTLPLNSTSNAPAAAAAGGEGGHKLIPASRRSLSSSSSSSGGGSPQAVQYSAFGAAVTEVELDLLTGERRVLATDIAYDCGYALNPRIDLGQVEGAFVMGLGVMLCEEVVVDSTGTLKSDSTWTYKIPTPDLIPQRFTVSFLSEAPNPVGIAGSKASGEPALMTATSALLALQQAAAAAAAEVEGWAGGGSGVVWGVYGQRMVGDGGFKVLTAPATPQRLKGVVGPFSIADALEAAVSRS